MIRSGEHLSAVAGRLGFDAAEVWNHQDNSALREQRVDPHVLAPGDVLYVPEAATGTLPLEAHRSNQYRAQQPRVQVELTLRSGDDAHSNIPFVVHGLAQHLDGESDEDGVVSFEVPAHVREVELELTQTGRRMRLVIGALDPIDTTQGIRSRLLNMGYLFAELLDDDPDPVERAIDLHDAVLAFQRDHDLPATAALDSATIASIHDAHDGAMG